MGVRERLKENYENNDITLLKYMRSIGCLSSKLSRRAKRRLEKARAQVQDDGQQDDDPMRDVLQSISDPDNNMLPTYGRGRGRGDGQPQDGVVGHDVAVHVDVGHGVIVHDDVGQDVVGQDDEDLLGNIY